MLRQTLARKVLVEKARRRERAEAEKRREQKPIKKRQSVAPVDAETLLKKAAAKVRTPAQPQRRGFSFVLVADVEQAGAPAEGDGQAEGPGAAGTGVAAGLRGAAQVQEGPHERRPARGDARATAGVMLFRHGCQFIPAAAGLNAMRTPRSTTAAQIEDVSGGSGRARARVGALEADIGVDRVNLDGPTA